jgi:hypothetical protein
MGFEKARQPVVPHEIQKLALLYLFTMRALPVATTGAGWRSDTATGRALRAVGRKT